jgi:hypothetical protein
MTSADSVPDHDQLAPMAVGAIYAFLGGEHVTSIRIDAELEDMGATVNGVANTFAVMAAAMLTEACGGQAQARAFAARWARKISEARRITAA